MITEAVALLYGLDKMPSGSESLAIRRIRNPKTGSRSLKTRASLAFPETDLEF